MMAVFIMLVGVGMAFIGSLLLLRFLGEFSKLITAFNEVYGGDPHSLNAELRAELNELNYSYYEILEGQDERISKLEKLSRELVSCEAPPFRVIDENEEGLEGVGSMESNLNDMGGGTGLASNEEQSSIYQIRTFYSQGKSVEEIAGELGLGQSYVDLILSLYVKKGEE